MHDFVRGEVRSKDGKAALPGWVGQMIQPSADGGQPALEPDYLKDPWGKEFLYDPAGGHISGRKPDISTTTPTGKVIGNWPGGR